MFATVMAFFIGCVVGVSLLYWLSVLLDIDIRLLWGSRKSDIFKR